MAREIHFYTDAQYAPGNGKRVYADWKESKFAINQLTNKDEVHTIQMGLLNDAWRLHWNCGDRVFLHDAVGVLEISAEMEERLLVPSDDVFRLWRDGAFEREKE